MKASTRRFIRAARQVRGFSLFDLIHGYVYTRWPYFYIGTAVNPPRPLRLPARFVDGLIRFRERLRQGPSSAKPTIADTYHGKVMPLESAKRLVRINEDVHLTVPEQVIPFAAARDIILENPGYIVKLDCPCRTAQENPCLPLDVCLIIGEPFAGFILEHQPEHAARITPDEAVAILEAEDRRGHVHHAFFKDAMLYRFYAICNCCTCCCGAMQAHRNGIPMLISSGYVCSVDIERCVGCGGCTQTCPFGALSVQDGHVVISTAECMGCGVCTRLCPKEALNLIPAADRPAPLDIEALAKTSKTAPAPPGNWPGSSAD